MISWFGIRKQQMCFQMKNTSRETCQNVFSETHNPRGEKNRKQGFEQCYRCPQRNLSNTRENPMASMPILPAVESAPIYWEFKTGKIKNRSARKAQIEDSFTSIFSDTSSSLPGLNTYKATPFSKRDGLSGNFIERYYPPYFF